MRIDYKPGIASEAKVIYHSESDIKIHLPSGNMIISITNEEADALSKAVDGALLLMSGQSMYAVNRMKLLVQSANMVFERLKAEGFMNEDGFKDRFIVGTHPDISADYVLNQLFQIPAMFNGKIRELHEDEDNAPFVDKSAHENWSSAKFVFNTLTDEQKEHVRSQKLVITNASTLAGLTKPVYFNKQDLLFKLDGGMLIQTVGEESQLIINEYGRLDLIEALTSASIAWEDLKLMEKGYKVMINTMVKYGLDEDYDFINFKDAEQAKGMQIALLDFKEAINNPRALASFIEKYKDNGESTSHTITISL